MGRLGTGSQLEVALHFHPYNLIRLIVANSNLVHWISWSLQEVRKHPLTSTTSTKVNTKSACSVANSVGLFISRTTPSYKHIWLNKREAGNGRKKKKERVCSVNQLRINKGRKIKLREQAGCALSLSLQKIQHNKLCFYRCNSSAFPPRLYLTLTTLTTHTHRCRHTHTNTSRVRDSGRHSYL